MSTHVSRFISSGSIALVVTFAAGSEAKAQMSAPLVGLVAAGGANSREIRSVVGVLGAASVQKPVPLPRDVSKAYLAPAGGWALILHRGGDLELLTFNGCIPGAIQSITGVGRDPEMVAFSPLGGSAALLYANGSLQVLDGLDATPHLAFEFNFDDPSGARRIAVSDGGQVAAVVTAVGQVDLLSKSTGQQLAYAGSPLLGVAFLPNQPTAVIADPGNGTIDLARLVDGTPDLQIVASGLSHSGGDALVGASRDGASVVVLGVGGTSVSRVELATGSIQTTDLPVPATRLDRLRDAESFLFSAERGQAAWILSDRDGGLSTVFAAPAAPTPIKAMTPVKEVWHP
jgi:hypothetical protein